ncbi:hypothetical protein M2323_002929 [Rhodoblastus acidophilus]|uniref:hypothetical protein n=1 Tax=Rhodoblastus acidophilus TaxID=1074 RepID=UPI0022256675|nr:hypothetical protein [Rhodoblastus acidophilus]MCW2284944.1 hypothetical protein [Rhodoblastus acidophilus]MCW2333992.1 hypothetical protein [Rhodoblastus acidophilus]
MEDDQDDKPKRRRSKRGDIVGSFYAEPELPAWSLRKRDWDGIADKCDLDFKDNSNRARIAISEISRRYFYARETEILAFNAVTVRKFVAKIESAANELVSLLSSETDSREMLATRDILSEALLNPLDLAPACRSGDSDFDIAMAAAIESANPLADAVRVVSRIAKAAKSLSPPETIDIGPSQRDPLWPKTPTSTAWAKMLRDIDRVFSALRLPTSAGNSKYSKEKPSQFTEFMLELTRCWPETFQLHNRGLDGKESPTAMASAINETRRSSRGSLAREAES